MPNLYAYFGKNETALSDYLALQNRKSTLKAREREVINLVVSEYNQCEYCLAAHTAIGKMNGFSEDQILEIRAGQAAFDQKLHALAQFVHSTVSNHGNASSETKEKLFASGFIEQNLIDIVIVIGDKIISNYLHNLTKIPVDFPAAKTLEPELQ